MPEFYISSNKYSLQERQTKKNGKVYDVVFRIVTLGGEEKQKKLSGYKTKTLAKQAYLEFVQEKCELVKNNPLKKKNTAKELLYVGELLKQYYAAMQNQCKDSTIYDRMHTLDAYVKPCYENTKVNDLTKEELYRWQDELWRKKNPRTDDYYSYAHLAKIRGFFSAFLTWVDGRYGFENNFKYVSKPKRRAPKTKMQFWKREEFEKFISVVDDPKYHCLFMTMFYTGRREGEIFALTPDDVKKDRIRFDKSISTKTTDGSLYKITSTKEEKVQDTPICPVLQKELATYVGEEPFFFSGEKPLPAQTVRNRFEKYIQKAGVKRIRVHDLRHSFVSMLIHEGANLAVVADLIDDTLEQVTKTYAHLYESDKNIVLSKIV